MVKAIAPAVTHTGQVGGRDRVFEEGFFDRLSDGINDVPLEALATIAAGGNRVVGPLTLYIRTTGNDSTGDGTSARPFTTLQGCYNYIASRYPNCYFVSLTLNMGAGTFAMALPFVNVLFTKNLILAGQGQSTVVTYSANIPITPTYGHHFRVTDLRLKPLGNYLVSFYGACMGSFNNWGIDFSSSSHNVQGIVSGGGAYVETTGTMHVISSVSVNGLFLAQDNGHVRVLNTSEDFSEWAATGRGNRAFNSYRGGRITLCSAVNATVAQGGSYNLASTFNSMIGCNTAANMNTWLALGTDHTLDSSSQIYGLAQPTSYPLAFQFRVDPETGEPVVSATGHLEETSGEDEQAGNEFVPDDSIIPSNPMPASASARKDPAPDAAARYLLNTTKSTYHDTDCADAVTGTLRTLTDIAALNPDAKPCGKCQPPAIQEE